MLRKSCDTLLLIALLTLPACNGNEVSIKPSDRSYLVLFGEVPIGDYRKTQITLENDEIRFTNTLTYRIWHDRVNQIEKQFYFDADSPNNLLRASYEVSSGESSTDLTVVESITVSADESTIVFDNGVETIRVREKYTLSDFVRAHPIDMDGPGANSTTTRRVIDFPGLRIRALQHTSSDLLAESSSTVSDSSLQLSASGSSPNLSTEDVSGPRDIHLRLAKTRSEATIWLKSSALFSLPTNVPIDQPIDNPRSAVRLTLRVVASTEGADIWETVVNSEGELAVDRTRSPTDLVPYIRSSSQTNRDVHPELSRIGHRIAAKPVSASKKLEQMISETRKLLTYREAPEYRTLDRVIQSGYGDCSEYVRVFEVISRASGFESYPVMGLVYDSNAGNFRVHLWSRIWLEGRWREVDPTLDQLELDATHIEFPTRNTLAILTQLPNFRFELGTVTYADSIAER